MASDRELSPELRGELEAAARGGGALERVIGWIAPQWARNRMQARLQMWAASGGYLAGRTDRAELAGWNSRPSTADEALADLDRIQARAVDLSRNSPLARAALNTKILSAVGVGMRYSATINRRILGMSDEAAEAWEARAEAEWLLASETKEIDAQRRLTFPQLTEAAARSAFEFGDVLVLLPMFDRPGSPYSQRVQLVESPRLCNPGHAADTDRLRDGVEFSDRGEPVAYHVADHHPWALRRTTPRNWQRVPAFASDGRPLALHIRRPGRINATRAEPLFAPVVDQLHQISRYSRAELMAAVVSSMFTAVLKSPGSVASLDPWARLTGGAKTQGGGDATAQKAVNLEMGNGTFVALPAGYEVDFADPKRPNATYADYYLAAAREVCAAVDVPYDRVRKTFETSYSSAMATMLEGWRAVLVEQAWIANELCQPVKNAIHWEAVALGRLAAPGFLTGDPLVRAAYSAAQWRGPARGQIRADVETRAAIDRVDARLGSRTNEAYALTGYDWETTERQLQREDEQIARGRSGGDDAGGAVGAGNLGEPEPGADDQPTDPTEGEGNA